MEINEFVKLGAELMNKHACKYKLRVNKNTSRLGVCNYKKQTIYISLHHIQTSTADEVKNTILHEIAHSLCKGEGHNHIWKKTFKELGGEGERLASEEISKKFVSEIKYKYTYVCPTCNHKSGAMRIWKRKKACYDCCINYSNGKYDHRFELKLMSTHQMRLE